MSNIPTVISILIYSIFLYLMVLTPSSATTQCHKYKNTQDCNQFKGREKIQCFACKDEIPKIDILEFNQPVNRLQEDSDGADFSTERELTNKAREDTDKIIDQNFEREILERGFLER